MIAFVLGVLVGATGATVYWHQTRFRRAIRAAVHTFGDEPPVIRVDG